MTVRFVGGDDVVETFIVKNEDGDVVNLTNATVTCAIWFYGFERDEVEVTLTNLNPAEDGTHGSVRLTPEQTAALPLGTNSALRLVIVDGAGLRYSTELETLERVA